MRIRQDRSRRRLKLDQQTYVEKILQQFNMAQDECRGNATPAHPGLRLSLADCSDEADRTERQRQRVRVYEALVGSVHYAAHSTRVDVAFAANQLARFSSGPGAAHWAAGMHLLRYLSETAELGLTYDGSAAESQSAGNGGELRLVAYTDADWAGDVDDRRSTTGYVVLLHGCAVSWASRKQSTVALSSTEAEYMGLSQGLAELKSLHAWMDEMTCAHREQRQRQPRQLPSRSTSR